jgi:hypothetical protein
MHRKGRTIVLALLVVVSFGAGAGAGAVQVSDGDALLLVDDRGEPLGAPVEACFVRDLGTDCVEVPAESGEVAWRAFDLLRVEGPGHGPVTVRRSEIQAGEDGTRRLTVPRKAALRVRGPAAGRSAAERASLSVALYTLADPDPLRPAHRIDLPAGAPGKAFVEVGVPAGDWILALESRGAAPDLHRLDAAPGGRAVLGYRSRAGWSLVVRARSAPEGGSEDRPVAEATVFVRPSAGPTPGTRRDSRGDTPPSYPPARSAETDGDGFALVSGIGSEGVDLAVVHPGYVDAESPGVAGRPGAFVIHDQELERGGRLEVSIVADDEPGAGWRCTLIDEAAGRVARSKPTEPGALERGSAEADREGLCVLERMPPGVFLLRAEEPAARSEDSGPAGAAERSVRVIGNETVRIDLELAPIAIDGTVTRGDRGVPGETIRVLSIGDRPTHGADTVAAEATTGEDGEYEATLWQPGKYLVFLMDRFGRPADTRFVDLDPNGDTVDFRLAEHGLRGIVVAEGESPPSEATVLFVWRSAERSGVSHSSVTPRPDGAFAIPLPAGGGVAELSAQGRDGSRSETLTIEVAEGVEVPFLTLRLRRPSGLRGVLTTAAGVPVAGGVVASFPLTGGGGDALGFARTDADGTFAIDPGSEPVVRLWATAPGCPLLRADVRVPAPAPASLEGSPVSLVCPGSSGTLRLRVRDPEGAPVPGYQVDLVVDGDPLPVAVLVSHLGNHGLAFASDASGELVAPGLPPGAVEVQGPAGVLGASLIPAGGVAELELVVEPHHTSEGR